MEFHKNALIKLATRWLVMQANREGKEKKFLQKKIIITDKDMTAAVANRQSTIVILV